MVQNWYLITIQSLLDLWQGFLVSIPKVLGSVIVFSVGWLISAGIGRLVAGALKKLKLNQIFRRTGWTEALRRAEVEVDPSQFLGSIVKWVFIIVFLLAAVEILGFAQFAVFLNKALAYLVDVIIALLIFVVAVVIADISEKVTKVSVERAGVGYSEVAGAIAKWSILGFSILAILLQLRVAEELVTTLFQGIVAVIVISVGLAFGLGGRDIAEDMLRQAKDKFER